MKRQAPPRSRFRPPRRVPAPPPNPVGPLDEATAAEVEVLRREATRLSFKDGLPADPARRVL